MALRSLLLAKVAGGVVALAGILCLVIAPIIGAAVFDHRFAIVPLTYVGGLLIIVGLVAIALAYVAPEWLGRRTGDESRDQGELWRDTTRQFFELFDHDLGRPLRRIAGKERELRAVLESSQASMDPAVRDLLDEIERQTPNFRLMLSNIQVLVQLEAPEGPLSIGPVEPSEVVRRIADRYTPVAIEGGKEITWWAEPPDFGIVSADASAIDHIVTNLVDNAVRYADRHVEVSLKRNDSRFSVRVWDDGPGIGPQYLEHVFGRGWTPEMARREEKTTSGLGLFIAHTLAERAGGGLTVESVAHPSDDHHTAFVLELPLNGQ